MKRFNINELIWVITLSLFNGILIYGISSGNIYNILSQRLVRLSYIGIVLISIFIISGIPRIFTVSDRGGLRKDSLLLLCAVMVMTLGVGSTAKGVASHGVVNIILVKEEHEHEEEMIPSGVIDMKDSEFYCYLEQMQKDPDKFIGRDIKVSGCIRYQGGQYLIAKSVMNCCAADVKVYGILLNIPENIKLEKDRDYTIYGKIKIRSVTIDNKIIKLPTINVNKAVAKV